MFRVQLCPSPIQNKELQTKIVPVFFEMRNKLTDPAILVLDIYPRQLKIYTRIKTCTQILMATFPQKWKQTWCPSTDKWINKTRSIHTMDYYLAIKRNRLFTHNMAEPWKHYGNSKKQVPKDHLLYDSI